MVLDGEGDPTTAFIFQIPADLITALGDARSGSSTGPTPATCSGRSARSATLGSGSRVRRHGHGRPEHHRRHDRRHRRPAARQRRPAVDAARQHDRPPGLRQRRREHQRHRPPAAAPAAPAAPAARAGTAPAARHAGRPARRPTRLRLPAARAPRPTTARRRLLRPPTTSIPSRRGPARPCTQGLHGHRSRQA